MSMESNSFRRDSEFVRFGDERSAMRALRISIRIFLPLGWRGLGECPQKEDAPRLRLSLIDGAELFPHSMRHLRSELEENLVRLGIEVRWSADVSQVIASGSLPDVPEVNIAFTPSDPSGPGWNLSPGAMGVCAGGGKTSTVFVFYRPVLRTLGLPQNGERPLRPQEFRHLTVALSRVIVHELVHRFAPSLPHASEGFMRADLDRRALTERHVTLDRRSREAMIRGLTEESVGDVERTREPM